MVTCIRKIVAERLADALHKSGYAQVGNLSHLIWAIRVDSVYKTPGSYARLTIPYELLQACGALEPLPRLQQKENAGRVINEVTCDQVIPRIEAEDRSLVANVDYRYFIQKTLKAVIAEKEKYGLLGILHQYMIDKGGTLTKTPKGQRLAVEYSSPNIAKPFHAGHLRSTILGNFVSNINEALGNQVVRINFLGDWGTQFGLLGVGLQKYGSADEMEKNPMHHLFQVYVKINEDSSKDDTVHREGMNFFKKMEDGDQDALSIWQRCRECSIQEYSRVYKRLGVHFDVYDGESCYQQESKDIINQLNDKGLLQYHSNSGVAFVDLATSEDKPLYANMVKSDGTTLYITRDVAAAISRFNKYRFDKIHYVVENGQHLHFQQLLRILQKLGQDWVERNLEDFHVKFGRVEGMSTRRGQVVFLEDILDEAQARMLEKMKTTHTTKVKENMAEVADKLGISAVIVQDLQDKRQRNYTFSWDRILKFTGNTGVFLQNTHAKMCSLEETCGTELNLECGLDALREREALSLVHHLAKFDQAVQWAYVKLEPYSIVRYLFQLAHLVGSANEVLRVRGQPLEVAQARLALFHCSRIALANGLRLIGITPLDKM